MFKYVAKKVSKSHQITENDPEYFDSGSLNFNSILVTK